MIEEIKRRRVRIIIILAAAIPVITAMLAFCGLGAYVRFNDRILPNVSISGVDVSGMTQGEALLSLNLPAYDSRGHGARLAVIFPDGSVLELSGEDVRLQHNAAEIVLDAFSDSRGSGFVKDTVTFLQRMYNPNSGARFHIGYVLETELLYAYAKDFTESYNRELDESGPQIYDDRIVIVKGAGDVRADADEVYYLALTGLYDSLSREQPVVIDYYLPESDTDMAGLLAIRHTIRSDVLSSEYDPETKTISDCAVGVDFDFDAAIALLDSTESGKSVTIGMEYTHPEITRQHLENLLFRDLFGECETQIAGSANRLNNIVLASEAVHGYILEPGEEFSFNSIVGIRTYERGYRAAPALMGGQTVQAIGGGICQVSSSIYSAILDTDISVTERYAHGRPVAYLPRGRDATVNWGTLDFKFVNNTDYPIRIDAVVTGRILTVQVFGTMWESETA